MKIKSAICAFFAFVVLSASAAWAAETPKPGKTKEETVRNQAVLKCKTEYPLFAEAISDAFAGKDAQQIKTKMRATFDKDKLAGVYYTKVTDRNVWTEAFGNTALSVGREIKKDNPNESPQKVRSNLNGLLGNYLENCTEDAYRALMN